MPIYLENAFKERIALGDYPPMRRVYLGDSLRYGLYDLSYLDRKTTYTPLDTELSTWYAWGKDRQLPGIVTNNDHFKDYFDKYKTHYDGWYDDYPYTLYRPVWQSDPLIQYITVDEHLDLELKAKWRQKQFEYSGIYGWDEGSGGGVGTRSTAPNAGDAGSYGSNVGTIMPNCTAYVKGRCNELGWNQPAYASGNAGDWVKNTINAVGQGNDDGRGWKAYYCSDPSQLKPGDIGCGGSGAGHVFFVEGDGNASGSYYVKSDAKVYTSSGVKVMDSANLPRPKYVDTYNRVFGALKSYCYMNGKGGYTSITWAWYHHVSIASEVKNGCNGTLYGYLRYSGGGGVVHKTESVSRGEHSLNQDNPTKPSPPKGKWESFNKYTNEREFDYSKPDWGAWKETSSSDWDLTW